MKKILVSVAFFFPQAIFAQQNIIATPAYDNVQREEQAKPSAKIPNQANYALIGNDSYNEKTYGLSPKYWLTLSTGRLKNIDPVSTEQAMFRKADYRYGIFLLHTPALKRNPEELLYPY